MNGADIQPCCHHHHHAGQERGSVRRVSEQPNKSPRPEVTLPPPPAPSGDDGNRRCNTEEKGLSSSRYLAVTWHRSPGLCRGAQGGGASGSARWAEGASAR